MNESTKRFVFFLNYLFRSSCMFPAYCFLQRTFSDLLAFLLGCGSKPFEWGAQ